MLQAHYNHKAQHPANEIQVFIDCDSPFIQNSKSQLHPKFQISYMNWKAYIQRSLHIGTKTSQNTIARTQMSFLQNSVLGFSQEAKQFFTCLMKSGDGKIREITARIFQGARLDREKACQGHS
jgi:hypothetical protein